MPLSPEEIATAAQTHAFVRYYEKQMAPTRWWVWLMVPVLILIMSQCMDLRTMLLYVLIFTFVGFTSYFALRLRYRQALLWLRVLENLFPDDLPWLQDQQFEAEIEKQLAAAKELEQEISRGEKA